MGGGGGFPCPLLCTAAAVLFWLNYKAAYDNWNEQRMALNKDIHMATKEVVDKLPGIQQTSAQAFSTLFLQLTVNDLGICLPITNTSQVICKSWCWESQSFLNNASNIYLVFMFIQQAAAGCHIFQKK